MLKVHRLSVKNYPYADDFQVSISSPDLSLNSRLIYASASSTSENLTKPLSQHIPTPRPAPSTTLPISAVGYTCLPITQTKNLCSSLTLLSLTPFSNLSENPVGSTFKIYQQSRHFSPSPSTTVFQATITSPPGFCDSLLLPASILVPCMYSQNSRQAGLLEFLVHSG